jgi:hypothetical protein
MVNMPRNLGNLANPVFLGNWRMAEIYAAKYIASQIVGGAARVKVTQWRQCGGSKI